MKKIKQFVAGNTVVVIAFVLAVITSFIVKPSRAYLDYIDFKTLVCLFSMLAVVCALKNISFFRLMAQKIVEMTHSVRSMVTALVFITYFGSMLIANDMALITFLPLGYYSLKLTHKEKYMAFTFILQNIAANLGGMLTPFGNPQNLFLYSKFNIPTGEFMSIMLPPFLAAVVMILGCCLFVKNEKTELEKQNVIKLPPVKTGIYLALFVLSILIVFRVVPYLIGFAVITAAIFFLDKDALKRVDYGLLMTFFCFFIFAGNMSNMQSVSRVLSKLLEKDTLIFSTLSCQFISNVPSAVLLSQFTGNYRELLWGVNVGGVGTLISSLASLITFREFAAHNHGREGGYVAEFSLINFGFLLVLTVFLILIR